MFCIYLVVIFFIRNRIVPSNKSHLFPILDTASKVPHNYTKFALPSIISNSCIIHCSKHESTISMHMAFLVNVHGPCPNGNYTGTLMCAPAEAHATRLSKTIAKRNAPTKRSAGHCWPHTIGHSDLHRHSSTLCWWSIATPAGQRMRTALVIKTWGTVAYIFFRAKHLISRYAARFCRHEWHVIEQFLLRRA